jgi:hypothetical protein
MVQRKFDDDDKVIPWIAASKSSDQKQNIGSVFLLHQIWIVKYSTVDCKYLLFLQDFFL